MKKAFLFVCGFIATSIVIAACGELTGPTSPETPINVTATLSGPSSATITWQKSAQSDGVISFNILRNGQKVGETEGMSFTDTGLGEKQTFKYTVSANCTSGLLSDPSPESPAATITTLDVTGPRIILISPFSNQTGVSTAATVTVTFNEPIDQATINNTTFSLKVTSTGANIPGTITYNPTTLVATFTPTGGLPSGASITATVTAGIKDLAGNPLQITPGSPGVWSFTTRDETPPTVLGFTPANGQVGVGTNPPITVTFSEAMDPNTINTSTITLRVTSTQALVPGTVTYTAATHVATFTPNAPLTVPVNYTIGVSTGVKDVAGNALVAAASSVFTTADLTAPTVASTSPASGATNVPVNSAISATFSKPMDQSTFTASTFQVKTTVTGTVVAGTFAYNAATNTVTFTPSANLASQTAYTATITTGVKDANGIAMAAPVTWTFSTADVTAPTVTAVSPTAGLTNVPINTAVNITFSEPMDQATIVAAGTITLKNTTTSAPVVGTVTYNSATNVATFTPTVALANGTGYTLTVSTAAKDASGNSLAAPFISTFTTAPAPDTTAPTVLSTNPADGASGVATSTTVTATFSEAMDASTITAAGTFTLKKTSDSAPVAGTVTYNALNNTATFTPTAPLSTNTGYTATITTAAKDLAGNQLAANKVWAFTTVDPPTVAPTSPTNGATGVSVNTTVTVTFSKTMDATTINTTTFKLKVTATSAAVAGTVSYNPATRVATFTPSAPLTANTNYTTTVTTGAKDSAGNPLQADAVFVFTTAP